MVFLDYVPTTTLIGVRGFWMMNNLARQVLARARILSQVFHPP